LAGVFVCAANAGAPTAKASASKIARNFTLSE
jgi:hypothetical protein